MVATLSNFNADYIKYLPGVTYTLNNTVTLRQLMQKAEDVKWEGSSLRFKVHLQRNHAIDFTSDGGSIPNAANQVYQEANTSRKFLVGQCQLTDGLMISAASTKNAAIDSVTSELGGLAEGLATVEGFFGYRDGTGEIGTVGTDTSGTTWGISDGRLWWPGKTYLILDTDGTTEHGTVQAASTAEIARALDGNGDTAVTSVAALPAAAATGDSVIWGTSNGLAITGLQALIDNTSGTFQGISTTNYPRYTSPVLANSGTARSNTPTLFRQALATVKQESGAMRKKWTYLTNNWQGIEVEELYESELRISVADKKVGLAVQTLTTSFGDVDIVLDDYAPLGRAFVVDFDVVQRAVQAELHWRTDGAGTLAVSHNNLSYVATALEVCEYIIRERNRCCRIDDLDETVSSAF